jgi:hypothetical protein
MEPTLASHSTCGAVSGIPLPDDLCIGTASFVYSCFVKKNFNCARPDARFKKKPSSVVFRSQNGANPQAPNGSEKVLMIASSHLLLNHEHARIDQTFAGDGGPGCLRALCQFLDTGCQPDFKIPDTKPGWGAVGLAVEGLKKGRHPTRPALEANTRRYPLHLATRRGRALPTRAMRPLAWELGKRSRAASMAAYVISVPAPSRNA